MSIHVEPAGTLEDNPQLRAFTISIIGPDRPGILDEVTRALRKSAISVVELQTRVGPAPMTGDRPFLQRSTCSRRPTQISERRVISCDIAKSGCGDFAGALARCVPLDARARSTRAE